MPDDFGEWLCKLPPEAAEKTVIELETYYLKKIISVEVMHISSTIITNTAKTSHYYTSDNCFDLCDVIFNLTGGCISGYLELEPNSIKMLVIDDVIGFMAEELLDGI